MVKLIQILSARIHRHPDFLLVSPGWVFESGTADEQSEQFSSRFSRLLKIPASGSGTHGRIHTGGAARRIRTFQAAVEMLPAGQQQVLRAVYSADARTVRGAAAELGIPVSDHLKTYFSVPAKRSLQQSGSV